MRPNLGHVKDVPAERLGLFRGHDLEVGSPSGEVSRLDGVPEVCGVVVWVLTGKSSGLGVGDGVVALVRLEVDLDVGERPVLFSELVSVAAVSVHVSDRFGGAAVGKEHHEGVDAFLVVVVEAGTRLASRLTIWMRVAYSQNYYHLSVIAI